MLMILRIVVTFFVVGVLVESYKRRITQTNFKEASAIINFVIFCILMFFIWRA